jgi:hypothetical protein
MSHWNSLWAHAPGETPSADAPTLWQPPWRSEHALALQTRQWDTLVNAGRSWWSFWMASAWPLPTLPTAGQVVPVSDAPTARVHEHPKAGKLPEPSAPHKRATRPDQKHSLQSRKR